MLTKEEYNILTFDLEDWYHILDLNMEIDLSASAEYPSCIEENVEKILNTLEDKKSSATFFVLGSIAGKNRQIIRDIANSGHEIASHGFDHKLVYQQKPDEFFKDIDCTKKLLEDIIGNKVSGFRAPGFSITKDVLWAFTCIKEAGYSYDSSIFPAKRAHGGLVVDNIEPHIIKTDAGDLIEIPVSVLKTSFTSLYLFGGGYFRITPYFIIKLSGRWLNRKNRPVISYFHPRDIDSKHPRLKMPAARHFKTYVNVGSRTAVKMNKILSDFRFVSCEAYIEKFI